MNFENITEDKLAAAIREFVILGNIWLVATLLAPNLQMKITCGTITGIYMTVVFLLVKQIIRG